MKRLYITLSLVVSACVGLHAQNIDVAGVTTIADGEGMCLGKHLSPSETPTGDSIHGIYGLEFSGEQLLVGDKVTFRSSFHNFLTEAECAAQNPPVNFADRYAWLSIYTLQQGQVDNNLLLFSYDAVDSIGMLLDWAHWQQYGTDSIRMYGPPHENFTTGQEYGFFVRSWGMGEDPNSPVNTDPDPENNWGVVKIVWNDCATSIGEMIAPRDKVNITVYPNPADGQVSVKYNFAKNVVGELYIRDISGRKVQTKKLGHILAGEHTFTVDVSGLTPGIYTAELNGGDFYGVAKFNKK